jgi:hypothetical protein
MDPRQTVLPAHNVIVRAHSVSPDQEAEYLKAGSPKFGDSVSVKQWAPDTIQGYAAILDHGLRQETRGIVNHVNDGWYEGTKGFFTNGLAEPYGSQGVGAHFEIGGTYNPLKGIYADGPPYQFLPLDAVAWHACDANAFTIGIEHAGFGYSTAEWEVTHFNMIGNSAYRAAWILRHYNLGPPKVSLTYPGTGDPNVWPHAAGGESWGGHSCPASTQNGVDYFPWELWLKFCNKAYKTKWGGAV